MEKYEHQVMDVALGLAMSLRGSCDPMTEEEERYAVDFLRMRLREWHPSFGSHSDFDAAVKSVAVAALDLHRESKRPAYPCAQCGLIGKWTSSHTHHGEDRSYHWFFCCGEHQTAWNRKNWPNTETLRGAPLSLEGAVPQ